VAGKDRSPHRGVKTIDIANENYYRLILAAWHTTATRGIIMLVIRTSALLTASLLLSSVSHADDSPEHFKGEPSHTLTQALANLSEYNQKLEAILKKDELSPQDMHEVHVLTYTLENALDKIDDSVDAMEDQLEDVHKASERGNTKTVKEQGKTYLDNARELTR
jgi:septal ring factor EnvC (AmiA/AmiB activator)